MMSSKPFVVLLVLVAVAAGAHVIIRGVKRIYTVVSPKPLVLLPIVGLVIAGLAVLFSEITGKRIAPLRVHT